MQHVIYPPQSDRYDWLPGVPSKRGIYWFYNGIRDKELGPAILFVFDTDKEPIYVARCGSGPLRHFHTTSLLPRTRHIEIRHDSPIDESDIPKFAWINGDEGIVAFAAYINRNAWGGRLEACLIYPDVRPNRTMMIARATIAKSFIRGIAVPGCPL